MRQPCFQLVAGEDALGHENMSCRAPEGCVGCGFAHYLQVALGFHRHQIRAYIGIDALDEPGSRLGYAAAHNDQLDIEQVYDSAQVDADQADGVIDYCGSDRVCQFDSVEYLARADLTFAGQRRQDHALARFVGSLSCTGNGRPGDVTLEAATSAAAAAMSIDFIVGGMAEVAGKAVRAAVEPAVQEKIAVIAGADRGSGEVALVHPHAPDRFRQNGLSHIGCHADRELKTLADQLAKRKVAPVQIGHQDSIAADEIDVAA